MKLFFRIVFSLALACVLIVAIHYNTIATGNTAQPHVDTLIVLGYPANPDGTPSPEQRERVLEAVREYRRGVASHLIMTGAAAHNAYTEAHIMALFATSQGVPSGDILEEPQALNTVQNIFYSATLMHQYGWRSAEIVSSPSHLPRAALILLAFDRRQPALGIDWRTHPSHWPPEYAFYRKLILYTGESIYCLRLRLEGFPNSRFLPAPAH